MQSIYDYQTPKHHKSINFFVLLRRHLPFLALLLIALTLLLPLAWMLTTSFKSTEDLRTYPPTVLPQHPTNNFNQVLGPFHFLLYAKNSLLIASLTVLGSTLSSALVAYGFAKIPFRGRTFFFTLMLATMMIPFPVTMTTTFLIFRWLGDTSHIQFLGTFKPLYLPAFFGSAFNIFLLRQFFLSIPEELSEAARLDGCSELGIFLRIILPLAKPALAVVALFAFMTAWNDFLAPLIYLQNPDQYTLSVGLQSLQFQHGGVPENLLMSAALLTLTPVLLLFLLVQKSFIEGIATTGMKG